MKLRSYIKPKPWFFNLIPGLNTYTANSIYPYIRQKRAGVFMLALKYLFDVEFRHAEELLAVKEAIKYLKSRGLSFNFNKNEKRDLIIYICTQFQNTMEKRILEEYGMRLFALHSSIPVSSKLN